MDWRPRIPLKAFPLSILGFLVAMAAPVNAAQEIGVPSYTEQAEPICRGFDESLPSPRGGRGKAEIVPISAWTRAELRQKAQALRETGRALRKISNELSALEFPEEHQSEFAEWLRFLKRAASHYEGAGKTLAAGHKAKALHLLHHLEFPPRLQFFEETVGFRYCRLEPERIAHGVLTFAR